MSGCSRKERLDASESVANRGGYRADKTRASVGRRGLLVVMRMGSLLGRRPPVGARSRNVACKSRVSKSNFFGGRVGHWGRKGKAGRNGWRWDRRAEEGRHRENGIVLEQLVDSRM